jgi:hypothetical protein
MAIPYDPNDTEGGFDRPQLGVPVAAHIGQCNETTSSNGNSMIVLEVAVDPGQIGEGFKTKYYLVQGKMFGFNVKRIMESAGMDAEKPDVIDDMTFRDKPVVIEFHEEKWTPQGETEAKTLTKIARFLPASQRPSAAVASGMPAEDEIPF